MNKNFRFVSQSSGNLLHESLMEQKKSLKRQKYLREKIEIEDRSGQCIREQILFEKNRQRFDQAKYQNKEDHNLCKILEKRKKRDQDYFQENKKKQEKQIYDQNLQALHQQREKERNKEYDFDFLEKEGQVFQKLDMSIQNKDEAMFQSIENQKRFLKEDIINQDKRFKFYLKEINDSYDLGVKRDISLKKYKEEVKKKIQDFQSKMNIKEKQCIIMLNGKLRKLKLMEMLEYSQFNEEEMNQKLQELDKPKGLHELEKTSILEYLQIFKTPFEDAVAQKNEYTVQKGYYKLESSKQSDNESEKSSSRQQNQNTVSQKQIKGNQQIKGSLVTLISKERNSNFGNKQKNPNWEQNQHHSLIQINDWNENQNYFSQNGFERISLTQNPENQQTEQEKILNLTISSIEDNQKENSDKFAIKNSNRSSNNRIKKTLILETNNSRKNSKFGNNLSKNNIDIQDEIDSSVQESEKFLNQIKENKQNKNLTPKQNFFLKPQEQIQNNIQILIEEQLYKRNNIQSLNDTFNENEYTNNTEQSIFMRKKPINDYNLQQLQSKIKGYRNQFEIKHRPSFFPEINKNVSRSSLHSLLTPLNLYSIKKQPKILFRNEQNLNNTLQDDNNVLKKL